MSVPALDMQGITAVYSDDVNILRDLTLTIPAGGFAGLVGLNGAGKSTVMKVIMGFLVPSAGRVHVNGEDTTGAAPHTMIDRGVWLIPQESSLFPFMTIEDNLYLPLEHLRRSGAIGKADVAQRIEEVYTTFPVLREKRRAQAGDLSGGQQKTLEFGKAFAVKPRLCLIDEPSIGLSPRIAKEIYGFISLFAKGGSTIVLIDHNVRRVVEMAKVTYVLTLGHVTAQGSREEFEGRLHEHVRQWLGVDI